MNFVFRLLRLIIVVKMTFHRFSKLFLENSVNFCAVKHIFMHLYKTFKIFSYSELNSITEYYMLQRFYDFTLKTVSFLIYFDSSCNKVVCNFYVIFILIIDVHIMLLTLIIVFVLRKYIFFLIHITIVYLSQSFE